MRTGKTAKKNISIIILTLLVVLLVSACGNKIKEWDPYIPGGSIETAIELGYDGEPFSSLTRDDAGKYYIFMCTYWDGNEEEGRYGFNITEYDKQGENPPYPHISIKDITIDEKYKNLIDYSYEDEVLCAVLVKLTDVYSIGDQPQYEFYGEDLEILTD